jgi:predicted ferric reductase
MVAATVGTGIMLAVVVASIVVVRRRLPYEAWYGIHLSVYAGIALAYVHQIPTGNEFTANAVQRDYWIALYVAVLAILVVYRVVAPVRASMRHRLRVERVVHEAPGVVSIVLRGRGLDRLAAAGGQFMVWRFLDRSRWWQAHPFSLSSAPTADRMRITVKAVGTYTRGLAHLAPGTRVLAEGPFGRFTAQARGGATSS